MRNIYLDFETYSPVSLEDFGAWNYSTHPEADVVCVGMATELHPAMCTTSVTEAIKMAEDPDTRVWAFNATFEQAIWENIMVKKYGAKPIPHSRWADAAVLVGMLGGPASLEDSATFLGLHIGKATTGKTLIGKICTPDRNGLRPIPNPDDLNALMDYCRRDVDVLKEIVRKLWVVNKLDYEFSLYAMCRDMNTRGIQIDRELCQAVVNMRPKADGEVNAQLHTLTKGYVQTVGQVQKIKEWLLAHGVKVDSLNKETAVQVLNNPEIPEKLKRVVELRVAFGKSSVAKYAKLLNLSDKSGVLRNYLQFYGTSTGRWSSKGSQLQNIPAGIDYKDVEYSWLRSIILRDEQDSILFEGGILRIIQNIIRRAIVPFLGDEFFIADFANIETRILFWLAEDRVALENLDKSDLYITTAESIYEATGFTKDNNPEERDLGKRTVLGCGYQMGAKTFYDTCRNRGKTIPRKLAAKSVRVYRQIFPKVPLLWSGLQEASIECVSTGKRTEYLGVVFTKENDILKMLLPTKRSLYYYEPAVKTVDKRVTLIDEDTGEERQTVMRTTCVFAKAWIKGEKRDVSLYGGFLTENAVQAIARDVLVVAMLKLREAGYKIVLTVHDEIVSSVKKGTSTIEEYCGLMKVSLYSEGKGACIIPANGAVASTYKKLK